MTTTDRMSNLDSNRTITDRIGETVILGNAVGAGALSSIATIVAGAAGKSEVKVPYAMSAISTVNFVNASFGIWAVFLNIIAAASFAGGGASVVSGKALATLQASLSLVSNASNLIGIQVFTATGAYTPTAGTVSIVAEALGAGGGGGGINAVTASTGTGGGGGGSGALATGRITSNFSGTTVTVGAAGAGGVAGSNNGTNGGTTSFGSVLNAGGGVGGTAGVASGTVHIKDGGIGGATNGSASIAGFSGQNGEPGMLIVSLAIGGSGGSSIYGGGGVETLISGASTPGNNASGFGAGGSGACGTIASAVARAGGNGTAGICLIYEYNV